MSWSMYVVGTPLAIQQAISRESARLTGMSKQEFDAARPHLDALVGLNFDNASQQKRLLTFQAGGHGVSSNGVMQVSNLQVELKPLPFTFVEETIDRDPSAEYIKDA